MKRIGYIGSKFKLKEWIFDEISKRTDSTYTHFSDLFSGSCVMTLEALNRGYKVASNDLEAYSHIIASGLRCPYTSELEQIINNLDTEKIQIEGFITNTYSPKGGRMFFTEENAIKIDTVRLLIEKLKDTVSSDEYNFLLASLLTSADTVKNTSVVYAAFLKNFKKTALRTMVLSPLHTRGTKADLETFIGDATKFDTPTDIAYIDPPYNSRQYGANYFVLNQIITPKESRGVTGVADYNKSSFCSKREVAASFANLVQNVNARVFVISYSSESLLTKEEMVEILSKQGRCDVVEREHKKFKAQDLVDGVSVTEYLFFVHK